MSGGKAYNPGIQGQKIANRYQNGRSRQKLLFPALSIFAIIPNTEQARQQECTNDPDSSITMEQDNMGGHFRKDHVASSRRVMGGIGKSSGKCHGQRRTVYFLEFN